MSQPLDLDTLAQRREDELEAESENERDEWGSQIDPGPEPCDWLTDRSAASGFDFPPED